MARRFEVNGASGLLRAGPIALMAVATVIFTFVLYDSRQRFVSLQAPAFATGWWLFATVMTLVLFNLRKKLPMVPAGRASGWLLYHAVAGVLAAALFCVHIHGFWPRGLYEQALAALFWSVTLSGVCGYIIQKLYPRHLVTVGGEVLFERVPSEVARLRGAAENVVLKATAEAGNDTLGRHYLDTLDWFFRKPRFLVSHAFLGRRSLHWLALQRRALEGYLNEAEKAHLLRLAALAEEKDRIDTHYTLQGLMKLWLLVHVPLSFATMTLACWHVIVVHVFIP